MKQYQIIAENGAPAGTQVCEGATCFPSLQPGQKRVSMPSTLGTSTTAPAMRQQITTVSPQGRLVQPQTSIPNPDGGAAILDQSAGTGVDPRLAALEAQLRAQQPAPTPADFARASEVPVAPPPTQSAPPLPMMPMPLPTMLPMTAQTALPTMLPDVASMQAGIRAQMPAYPQANLPQGNGGYRPSITGPAGYAGPGGVGVFGGAAAGPGYVRSARLDTSNIPQYQRKFNAAGRPYASAGSHRSPQYNALRAKGNAMASKVRGMAARLRGGGGYGGGGYRGGGGGGYGGYSSSYSTSGPSQQAIDKAYEKYNAQLSHPPPQKATGWAKKTLGANHGMYPALVTHPLELLANKGIGIDPFQQSGTYDWMDRLPIADLAMITGSTTKGGMMRKTWQPKVPGVLKEIGVKPTDPDFKKEFDYSKYAKELAGLYRGLNSPDYVLDKTRLMSNLANSQKNAALRQGLTQQTYYGDPGGAINRAKGYFNSVFDATEDDLAASVHSRMADRYFAQAGLINRGAKATGGGDVKNIINKGRGGPDLSKTVTEIARKFGYY